MLTVAAIVLTATTFLLNIVVKKNWLIRFSIPTLILCSILILISILFFVNVLRTRDFSNIKYAPLLTEKELSEDNVIVQHRLIKAYHKAIEENKEVLKKKIRSFNWGVGTLFLVLVLLLILLISTFCTIING